ncbi:MAG TPA: glycosyltransferase [Opitutaceae bacterium]|nr:glycosyltransferase [Opitutaceae bacterium]
MKLCHVVPSLQEQHGGPSKSVRLLCSALARLGHDVQLFSTHPDAARTGDITTDGSLRVVVFRREWPQRLCRSTGLDRALKVSGSAVIHHHSLWLRTLHYAHRRAAESGAALVVSPRGMMSAWAWRHRGWRKQFSRTLVHPHALSDADGWHATSDEEAADIRDLQFAAPVCIAPNGVEPPAAAEVLAARDYWHEQCPDTLTHRTALFYSRFHQKKRVLELIDLWLERAPKDWLLLLVGIPQEYTPEALERYILKMSGTGRIRVFSGAGRPPPYAVASLFLLPSHSENFGLVVAEAMAHRVCALVTDTTPWSALNLDQRGWCVPWARFGDELLAATSHSPTELRDRGERAAGWVLREFSWDRAAGTLADFYRRLRPAAP